MKWKDFRDGLTNTITVVEIANSNIHWAEPRDLIFDEVQRVADGADRRAANVVPLQAIVCFADGSVRVIGPETSAED